MSLLMGEEWRKPELTSQERRNSSLARALQLRGRFLKGLSQAEFEPGQKRVGTERCVLGTELNESSDENQTAKTRRNSNNPTLEET